MAQSLKQINEQLAAIEKEAQRKVQALADTYRTQQLIPFCRRYKLTYLAAMGSTVFYNKKGYPVSSADLKSLDRATARIAKALAPIEEFLNIECLGHNDCFGFYIDEINEEDW